MLTAITNLYLDLTLALDTLIWEYLAPWVLWAPAIAAVAGVWHVVNNVVN